jgi:hypothetical protein
LKLSRKSLLAAGAAALFASAAAQASAAPGCQATRGALVPAIPAVTTPGDPGVSATPDQVVPGSYLADGTWLPGYTIPGNPGIPPTPAQIITPAVPGYRMFTCANVLADQGWTVVPRSLLVRREGFSGEFTGTARVTNRTGSTARAASFTITVFSGRRQVGTLLGTVNRVTRSRTVTVQLLSTDRYVQPTRYAFQVDYSF